MNRIFFRKILVVMLIASAIFATSCKKDEPGPGEKPKVSMASVSYRYSFDPEMFKYLSLMVIYNDASGREIKKQVTSETSLPINIDYNFVSFPATAPARFVWTKTGVTPENKVNFYVMLEIEAFTLIEQIGEMETKSYEGSLVASPENFDNVADSFISNEMNYKNVTIDEYGVVKF